jgi:hypothetical protein
MFDDKPEVAEHALRAFQKAKSILNKEVEYIGAIAFDSDERHAPLQAADFLAYEWRKRISDARQRPNKAVRKSWERIRAARSDGALWRYGRSMFDDALKVDSVSGDQTWAYINSVLGKQPTDRD